jgi:endonuclease-3
MAQKKKTTKKTTKKKATRKTAKKAAPKKAPSKSIDVDAMLDILAQTYPDATTALDWETPLQLLVATILSAQCTDERVNMVTPDLFRQYPDAGAFAAAKLPELEEAIRTTGFFRNKAKAIKGACKTIVEDHGGEVPRTMEAMVELPGVARKTANVVLGTAFGLATGVVVDTHVKRLAGRLGMSAETDPQKIERDLMRVIPEESWVSGGHRLVLHGRHVCQARKPRCGECPLSGICPSAETSPDQGGAGGAGARADVGEGGKKRAEGPRTPRRQ